MQWSESTVAVATAARYQSDVRLKSGCGREHAARRHGQSIISLPVHSPRQPQGASFGGNDEG